MVEHVEFVRLDLEGVAFGVNIYDAIAGKGCQQLLLATGQESVHCLHVFRGARGLLGRKPGRNQPLVRIERILAWALVADLPIAADPAGVGVLFQIPANPLLGDPFRLGRRPEGRAARDRTDGPFLWPFGIDQLEPGRLGPLTRARVAAPDRQREVQLRRVGDPPGVFGFEVSNSGAERSPPFLIWRFGWLSRHGYFPGLVESLEHVGRESVQSARLASACKRCGVANPSPDQATGQIGRYLHNGSPDAYSADAFAHMLSSAGLPTTKDQLRRWHRAGLLPQPRVVHLGRGKGTESWYPASAYAQAQAIHRALGLDRDFKAVGWQLWLWGFDVPDRYLRDVLANAAQSADEALAYVGQFLIPQDRSDAEDEAAAHAFDLFLDQLYDAKTDIILFKHLRHALRRDRLKALMIEVCRIGLGQFDSFSAKPELYDPDRIIQSQLFDLAMGVRAARQNVIDGRRPWLDGDIGPILARVSDLLGSGSMTDMLAEMSDAEILAGKNEVVAIANIVRVLLDASLRMFGEDALGYARLVQLLQKTKPDELATVLLCWFKIRPIFGESAEKFIADISELTHAADVISEEVADRKIKKTKLVFPYNESEML